MLYLRFVALTLLMAPALPTAAQPDYARFIPLALGNEWQFEQVDGAGNPLGGVEQFVVVGDTTLGEDDYFTYVRRSYDATGAPGAVATCAARTVTAVYSGRLTVTADVVPLGESDYSDCELDQCFPDPISVLTHFESGGSVEVGGQVYAVEATIWVGDGSFDPGGHTQSWWSYNALDIGPYLCTYEVNHGVRRHTLLQYAKIGGDEYGATAVGNEPGAPLLSSLGVAAYPNPFASDLKVAIRGAAGPVTVELVDLLGRSVATTRATLRSGEAGVLDIVVPPRLPTGLYVVRVRGADGGDVAVPVVKM